MTHINIDGQLHKIGLLHPNVELGKLKTLISQKNWFVCGISQITQIKQLKVLLYGLWNHGDLFSVLAQENDIDSVENIIDNQYVGSYVDIKELIEDVLDIPSKYYRYLDIPKSIKYIEILHYIKISPTQVYLLKRKTITLDLEDIDRNANSLIAAFRRQAKNEGWTETEINDVIKDAKSKDYDHLVQTLDNYCESE